jgi:hypothetical protein
MSNNIEVLFNSCFGGFSLSDEAVTEINKCFQENNKKKISRHCSTIDFRTDPDVLKIYNLLGSERFSGNYSNISTESIDSKYKNFIHIEEYDGLENVTVNIPQYNLYKINEILNSNSLTDSQKIEELKKITKYSNYFEIENE